ncbi:alpha/beta fold hydrolase [Streptomyces sp. MUM 203J]|uniref:alpha/beta hydrolase n=1 Tax=Streptomyces sp. MUM 203J TaxID=2791990 RepID=UPI001F03A008|nr:alpha/beta hydrolase [Streptomyces sp. MUM 203J]MCH0541306.1 alpha/beta fold hydrolase [Streptomyces sp. MUM 203J]
MGGPRPTRIRTGAAVAAALLLAGAVTGCELGGGATGDGKDTGSLTWGPCEARDGGEPPSAEWSCATATVPVDHAKPDGEKMPVALIRKAATRKSERIGSLLFNFGGPGASGVEQLSAQATAYTNLNTRYDLVGFDPRGVGGSSAVVCWGDAEQEKSLTETDATPDTPAEEAALIGSAEDFSSACSRRAGKLLPHLTTSNTARDLDLVRQALGDGKLHYLGFSYGTELGAVYAHLFPEKVGRLVLDAVVDPTADTAGHARHQTIGFQRALNNYFTKNGEKPEAGTARLAALLERLDSEPLPTSSGRRVTESLAVTGMAAALYSEESWPYLTQALKEAERGNGNTLLALADLYTDRDASGHYSTMAHSQRAISCADNSERPTVDDARGLLPEFTRISPVFGAFLAWDTASWCAGWPAAGERVTPDVSAPGAAPILVVGTTGDSATPYEGAKIMARELGDGVGVLVTNEGEGHGAYGSGACVTRVTDDYLLKGVVPENGTTCQG